MGAIKLTQFGGLRPALSPRLLPDNGAEIADNCDLSSGEIRPLYAGRSDYLSSKSGNQTSIYQAVEGANAFWMTWPLDVDVIKAPISVESTPRWAYTGDGEPRITTHALATAGGANDYPAQFYSLGVPAPQTSPTVTPSGGTGAATTRAYGYTFFSAWGEESAPNPIALTDLVVGKVDDTWAITGLDAVPANSGTGTATYASGTTTFTNAASAKHWLRVGDEVVISGATLRVSAVTSASVFKVPGDYHAATTWARKAPWNTTGMKRRLYRTTGTLGGWQLVHDDVGTTYNDTLSDAQILGDVLLSEGWETPDPYLTGIVLMASGVAVGFRGNTLYVSYPNQIHAWVRSFNTDQEIVGLCAYGDTVIVGTRGVPYGLSGSDPDSMALNRIEVAYPCLSKRSMVSLGTGVGYASGEGFVIVGDSAPSVMTAGLYSRVQWMALNPATMFACATAARLVIAHDTADGGVGQLVFESGVHTTASVACADLFAAPDTGSLYLSDGAEILQFDASTAASLYATWRSKQITIPAPMSLGAYKLRMRNRFSSAEIAQRQAVIDAVAAANAVLVASGSIGGALNAAALNGLRVNGSDLAVAPEPLQAPAVSVSFLVDGELVHSASVLDNEMRRLPQYGRYDRVAIEVTANVEVQEIVLGETPSSLKGA